MILGVSRALDAQLEYQQTHQDYFLGNFRGPDQPVDLDRDTSTGPSFLSDSVTGIFTLTILLISLQCSYFFFTIPVGSPRHRKKLAGNALAIAAEMGKPHCFTTMTANPHWPEIVEMLLPGQTAYDRPELVCRVFHARKQALIHNLKHGHYFDGQKCAYILHVIEYQHRGLPHAHIVYRLEDGPDHSSEAECVAFMDRYITAKKPVCSSTELDPEMIRYCALVETHMTHKCVHNEVNGCLDKDELCKKKFSPLTVPVTHLDDKSYPVYARPEAKDCYIVPHCKQMLLDCDCHVNTEFCASTYTLIYLYKYLFKGKQDTNKHSLHTLTFIFVCRQQKDPTGFA